MKRRPGCSPCSACSSHGSTGPARSWPIGSDVTDRTVRKDVARLRDLGYPVDAVRGPGGRYRLGVGAKLPAAAARRRRGRRGGRRPPRGDRDGRFRGDRRPGAREAGAGAAGQAAPPSERAARRPPAPGRSTPTPTSRTRWSTPSLLNELAAAIRDHQGLRCYYRDAAAARSSPTTWSAGNAAGTSSAATRPPATGRRTGSTGCGCALPGGRRFAPTPFPGDLTEFVVREVARTGWAVHARIRVHAPAEEVLARINPAVGTVEAVTDQESVLVTGGDSLEVVAVWIGMLGLDFSVTSPPALIDHLRAARRALRPRDRDRRGTRRPSPRCAPARCCACSRGTPAASRAARRTGRGPRAGASGRRTTRRRWCRSGSAAR